MGVLKSGAGTPLRTMAGHFAYRAFEIIRRFNFQLVEKFEHVETFQLIEINFRFVENVNFPVITFTTY